MNIKLNATHLSAYAAPNGTKTINEFFGETSRTHPLPDNKVLVENHNGVFVVHLNEEYKVVGVYPGGV